MHVTLGRALAAAAAILAMAAPATAMASAGAAQATNITGTSTSAPSARHVVLVGIGGLRWADISPTTTPALWRLAGQGSVGSLVVSGIDPRTCPAGGWLTLNAAARAAVPHTAAGPCPRTPQVTVQPSSASPGTPSPAQVPRMPGLVTYNTQFHYNPQWGLLASAPGPGRCATAAGPGAALALASPVGRVASYLPSPSALTAATLARCPLTVVDLGNLPAAPGPAGASARAVAARAADRQLGRIIAGLPPGSTLVVAAPGDGPEPHLRAIVVSGPHYRNGLLTAASTRQPGLVTLTDLTPTVLGWLGTPVTSAVVGSPLTATPRDSLAAVVRTLTAQDTAAQVYRHTVTPFYQLVGFGYPLLFALIWAIPWGRGERRRPRRRAVARVAGTWAASVPAGTFLASLVPWWTMPHPAAVLYSLAVAWAAVVAAAALAGPWRRDPLGPPGVIAAVTLGVIGLDLIAGTRLALETPFGLHVLEAGRFYGLGNNAVVIYGASAILCAAWLGGALLRRGQRSRALLAMAAVTGSAVVVAAWPGFGAKVGGTIAMLPGFLLLLAAAANVRITWRRAALAAVSGLALVTVFALVDYFVPVAGHSDIGGFVGQVLHGGAGATLQRKISSNLGSLTANPFVLVIPVVVAGLGAIVAWPARLRCALLVCAYRQIPLLQAAFSAVWLVAVLSWFAEDSGVTVPAAALPLVLPLVVVILSSLPAGDEGPAADGGRPAGEDQAASEGHAAQQGHPVPASLEDVSGRGQVPAAGDPPVQSSDSARSGPGAARLSLGPARLSLGMSRGELRDCPGERQHADSGSGWWRNPVKYQVSRTVVGPPLRLLWRPEITGGEHIPRTGGAIVASNHLSMVDSIFLPLMLERPLTFAAKSEYFAGGKRPAQLFAAAYMRATKQLSVDRDSARAAQDTLHAALALLQAGELFGVYPEGTRSPDGRLYRGRTGVGWLALASGVPVIPVAMIGTDRVLPPGHTIPQLHQVGIRIGEPMTFEGYRDKDPAARARRAITDDVMKAIQALSGQEYVPIYASVRKEELNGRTGKTL